MFNCFRSVNQNKSSSIHQVMFDIVVVHLRECTHRRRHQRKNDCGKRLDGVMWRHCRCRLHWRLYPSLGEWLVAPYKSPKKCIGTHSQWPVRLPLAWCSCHLLPLATLALVLPVLRLVLQADASSRGYRPLSCACTPGEPGSVADLLCPHHERSCPSIA